MSQHKTTTFTPEQLIYLERTFLDRGDLGLIYLEGAVEKKLPKNHGFSMTWNRNKDETTDNETPLTEGQNPASSGSITNETVKADLNEYGKVYDFSTRLLKTGIDKDLKEKVETIADRAMLTIDTIVRDELVRGATTLFANKKSALSALAATDVLSSADILRARATLKKNGARPYQDGYYIGKVGPDTSYDIMQDKAWVNVNTYQGQGQKIYKGELGKLLGIRFIECASNQKSEKGGVGSINLFSNIFHGQEAFGTVTLADDREAGSKGSYKNLHLIIKTPGEHDIANALNMAMTIGWKATFATKVLNPKFIVNVKSASTAGL